MTSSSSRIVGVCRCLLICDQETCPVEYEDVKRTLTRDRYEFVVTKNVAEGLSLLKRGGQGQADEPVFDLVVSKLGTGTHGDAHIDDLLSWVKQIDPRIFVLVWSRTATRDARMRLELADRGANMVSDVLSDLERAVRDIAKIKRSRPVCVPVDDVGRTAGFHCPFCKMEHLSEDGLWLHMPLYHINLENERSRMTCPICAKPAKPCLQVHIRNAHGPCARGEIESEFTEHPTSLNAFALVVCIHGGKVLLVQEFANSGYWLPGGRVDGGESLKSAAERECEEEAGVRVEITGILQFQHSASKGRDENHVRLRVIFFAVPLMSDESSETGAVRHAKENEWPAAKTTPDFESAGACWVPLEDMSDLRYRGSEPLTWVKYIQEGGVIYPVKGLLSSKEK